MDVINIMQNNIIIQKISKLVSKNEKRIFGIYDKGSSYYKRPATSNNRLLDYAKNIESNV